MKLDFLILKSSGELAGPTWLKRECIVGVSRNNISVSHRDPPEVCNMIFLFCYLLTFPNSALTSRSGADWVHSVGRDWERVGPHCRRGARVHKRRLRAAGYQTSGGGCVCHRLPTCLPHCPAHRLAGSPHFDILNCIWLYAHPVFIAPPDSYNELVLQCSFLYSLRREPSGSLTLRSLHAMWNMPLWRMNK